jgi:hypothetical protein
MGARALPPLYHTEKGKNPGSTGSCGSFACKIEWPAKMNCPQDNNFNLSHICKSLGIMISGYLIQNREWLFYGE